MIKQYSALEPVNLSANSCSMPPEFKFGDHVEVVCGDNDWSKAVFIRKVDGPYPYECLLQCPWGDHATEVRGVHCRHADW